MNTCPCIQAGLETADLRVDVLDGMPHTLGCFRVAYALEADSRWSSSVPYVANTLTEAPEPRGGGNPKLRLTYREMEISMENHDGVFYAGWAGIMKREYEITIEIVNYFFNNVTNKSQTGTIHPVFGISTIVLTNDQYGALAELAYGHRKNPKKALGQLMSYAGMAARSMRVGNNHTLAFNPQTYNFNGYRLVSGGDSGGRPSVKYVYSLDEATHTYLEQFYSGLPAQEQQKWAWEQDRVAIVRRVSKDPISCKNVMDKTELP